MRKLAAIVICSLSVALSGCFADAPPPAATTPAVAVPSLPAGKLSKAAQKRLDRKRALKLDTMVKHEPTVQPSGE